MPTFIDLDTWPRREVFEFYRDFDKPFFNVCLRLDVTNLLNELKRHESVSVALTYRLRDGRVLVHDVIHGGTTLMLPNETFTLVYFDYARTFGEFIGPAQRALAERKKDGGFNPRHNDDARIHCTTLPWIAFTSFSHARNSRRDDSVPKISFGKFIRENERTLMPFSVEVHHALVDGLHVGRYIARIEELLAQPELYLNETVDA